jgi:hypothetical protein
MASMLDPLARYARPILLIVAGFLATGATLIVFAMPFVGWTIYGIGFLGLLLAVPTLAAVYRRSLDWFAWLTLAVLYIGVVVGIPVLLAVWGHYLQNPGTQDAVMAHEVTPLGMVAGAIKWVGLGLFGIAAYRVRPIPAGGVVMFPIAALIALPAEFGLFTVLAWGLAVILAAFALVWVAPEPEDRRAFMAESAAADAGPADL